MEDRTFSYCFQRGSYIPLDEDKSLEFKMHTNISVEELPEWLKVTRHNRSRRAVSRNINGFLNTGLGGTICLGIQDDGMIRGIPLSNNQKEHIVVSLEDVLNRYTPPVPSDMYQISFVPVLKKEEIESGHEIQWIPQPVNKRAHLVRTDKCCWCFQCKKGDRFPLYVIKIMINPSPQTQVVRQLYLDEEQKCYYRKSACVWPCSYSEVIRRTKEEVTEYYLSKKLS